MSAEANQRKKSKFKAIIVSIGFTCSLWLLWIGFGNVLSSCCPTDNANMASGTSYQTRSLLLYALPYNATCGMPPFIAGWWDGLAHLQEQPGNTCRISMWRTCDPNIKYYVYDLFNDNGTITFSRNGYNSLLDPQLTYSISGYPVVSYLSPKPGVAISEFTFALQFKDMCTCSSGTSTQLGALRHFFKFTASPSNVAQAAQYFTNIDETIQCNYSLPATF